MFSRHVSKELSAYCHDELTVKESREIAEHLIACQRCRREFEEIKLGVKLAESLPEIEAPEALWNNLNSLIDNQRNGESLKIAKPVRSRARVWLPRFAAVAALLLLALSLGAIWIYRLESRPAWEVARLEGAPTIGSARVSDKGQLGLGQWLETDDVSRAQVNVSSIGHVEIEPNTRVRLLATRPTEHRLELARGRMSARIWAPPRLFFVDTPSAVAADLGCAYTLEVDDEGGSLLRVTSGWVALQLKDRESIVPAGAACATRPGVGPGTPYFQDASEPFRTALWKVDFTSPQVSDWHASLETVLREARLRDTITLWHLISRVEGDERAKVYERLAALVPPPEGVTREGSLQLNEQMLSLWKSKLESHWSSDSGLRKAWIKIWSRSLGKVKGFEGKK